MCGVLIKISMSLCVSEPTGRDNNRLHTHTEVLDRMNFYLKGPAYSMFTVFISDYTHSFFINEERV